MADDLLTLREAAERIGQPVHWLRRHLHAVEERTGQRVLVRVGRGRKRPTYRVHLGRLQAICPELFDVRDPIANALRESAIVGRRVERQIDEINEKIDELFPALGAVAERIRRGR